MINTTENIYPDYHLLLLWSTINDCVYRTLTRLNVADWQQESVLIASGSDVLRMSTDHVGGLIDDVIFSAAGGDVIAMSYDSVMGTLYMAVSSDEPDGDYIARVGLQQLPSSR